MRYLANDGPASSGDGRPRRLWDPQIDLRWLLNLVWERYEPTVAKATCESILVQSGFQVKNVSDVEGLVLAVVAIDILFSEQHISLQRLYERLAAVDVLRTRHLKDFDRVDRLIMQLETAGIVLSNDVLREIFSGDNLSLILNPCAGRQHDDRHSC